MRQESAVWHGRVGWRASGICMTACTLEVTGRFSDPLQVRVPLADATVMKAPEGIEDNALVLMADIFPTGQYPLAVV